MSGGLSIHIDFDLICPWCFIGKSNLDQALALVRVTWPKTQISVHWRPVQLLPELPESGVDFEQFYLHRLGSVDAITRRRAFVQAAARQAGVALNFDLIRVLPNTARPHGLLESARASGGAAAHEKLLDKLFRSYFQEGEDIGNADTLTRLVPHMASELRAAPPPALPPPPHGVPHFVFGRREAVAGASSAQSLFHFCRRAIERES